MSQKNGIAVAIPLTIEMFHKDMSSGRGICSLINIIWM